MSNLPKRTVILLGGGHAHALCLRELGLRKLRSGKLEGARIILVSDVTHAPYSGMLPGLIAGHYTYDDAHIDLPKLAKFAGSDLIVSKCKGLDLLNRELLLESGEKISFDILSVNIGSTPSRNGIPGADDFAIPAKPVPQLLKAWNSVLGIKESGNSIQINIVGGGAGGVELALNMKKRLGPSVGITVITQDEEILRTHNHKVRKILRGILAARYVNVRTGVRVQKVFPDNVVDVLGNKYPCTHTILVTTASAPSWIKESGIAVDSAGFIEINRNLQSISHPFVFAAGDIASMSADPRPKSGVFAVRQAGPLVKNIKAILRGRPLTPYYPQKLFLSLIGTGECSAVASWGSFAWHSPVLWWLKDFIDRRFMKKFMNI